ncbi:PASTA domain-containing protein [Micromonospora sp. NBC_00898]|uniref:PASTA domain-containing protein n=1 Tax=Micromonospora sp. NBC_00898 TaxID=2975981 RepID=UPI00386FFA74|nr:PASTA domain-containing protein [Micromonospora sp. NBC_00898]
MTDGYPERQTSPGQADPGPDRARLLLGGGLAVALLAVIGASGGWILAGGDSGASDRPVAAVTTVPAPTEATPPTDAPRTTPPVTRTTARATPAGLTVPELVGVDFEDARRQLHERKLGWRLVFGAGAGRNVERTSPEPGTPVRRGVTVTLWVAGPAPALAVPDLVGDDCAAAADDLVEAGLYPRYRTGRRGSVTAQAPVAGTRARWNDPVTLVCGDPPSSPPASPAPTP